MQALARFLRWPRNNWFAVWHKQQSCRSGQFALSASNGVNLLL